MERIMKSLVRSSYITSSILILLGLVLVVKSEETITAISYLVGGASIKFLSSNTGLHLLNSLRIVKRIYLIILILYMVSLQSYLVSL